MTEFTGSLYPYSPSHVAPAIFSVLVGISACIHTYQNFRYKFWRITFFMIWGGAVFTAGWVLRTTSSYDPANKNLYIAQTCLILAGPPIFAAAEYNILGRLMHYLPMHAPLHPGRVVIFFIYLGAAVESLTAAGASMMSSAQGDNLDAYRRGGTLISISLVLQAAVECVFIYMVALIHHRCIKARMLPRNVRIIVFTLYGTATFVLIRCIFRAIESFGTLTVITAGECTALCRFVSWNEWYIFVFEAVPMILYTYWLNLIHPGKLIPREKHRYLDIDGQTERMGPGWIDRRSYWETWADPFDMVNTWRGHPKYEQFWLHPDEWPVAHGGSFASGAATNVRKVHEGRKYRKASVEPEEMRKVSAHGNI